MKSKLWNRRQILQTSAKFAAGVALTSLTKTASALQLPPPPPLQDDRLTFVTTTEAAPWQKGATFKPSFGWDFLNLNVDPDQFILEGRAAGIEGFGACFNELGWTSLSALSDPDRESVLHEFFDPTAGARFTYCRMPIGANDFATEAYSYDETDGDFDLKHFSIDHDKKTLVPFIQAAQRYQPKLRLWASPWSPPSWMKRNHFYAEAKAFPGMKENGIRPEQVGHEGEDMFIQEPRYFDAYARYFARFIEAYGAEGIRVGMVMPQNEFNSAQNFPSCTWTPEGLTAFLHYLAPEMEKRGVEIFFGTLERGDPKMLEKVMADKVVAPFIKGVGVQWAGKNALPAIHSKFPEVTIFQSEQECGDGSNSWSYTSYCWQLMKDYFRNGARGYMYWNISTATGGTSTWGWPQNALVCVDTTAKTFHYNHDYYLLKHLTHFVDVGARRLDITGTCDDALGFLNPNGTLVLLVRNELPHPQMVQVGVKDRAFIVELPPDSVGTVAIRS
jgi:glucosylceramidase